MQYIITLLLFSFLSNAVVAQSAAQVSGTIKNAENGVVMLTVDPYGLRQDMIKHSRTIEDAAPDTPNEVDFSYEIPLTESVVAELYVPGAMIPLYLKPGDKLNVIVDAGSPEMATFTGDGSVDNELLYSFYQKFEESYDHEQMEAAMIASTSIDAWEMKIFNNRKEQWDFYKNSPLNATLSKEFKTFLEDQITYNYYDMLLAYPIIRGNKNLSAAKVEELPKVMVKSLDDKLAHKPDMLKSEAYRSFLNYYVTYFTSEKNQFDKFKDWNTSLERKLAYALDNMEGKSLAFIHSKILLDHCGKITPDTYKAAYKRLEEMDGSEVYADIVKRICDGRQVKEAKKVEASEPPAKKDDLEVMGLDGKNFSLSRLKGKVVYIDVWASWCGPCRMQFPYTKQMKEKLTEKEKKQIEFLYISIDNNEEAWRSAVEKYDLEGVHGFSRGGWGSPAVKHFGIMSIPRYLLMDQKGNIVDPNAKRPSTMDAILQDIRNLL